MKSQNYPVFVRPQSQVLRRVERLACSMAAAEQSRLFVATRNREELGGLKDALSGQATDREQFVFVDDATSKEVATSFQPGNYFRRLQTRVLGNVGLFSPSLHSTQEFVKTHSGLLPDGAVVVADIQTSGKGRQKNKWESPEGCLMFTVTKSLQLDGPKAVYLNYVISLAVVEAVQEAFKGQKADFRLKWPNDLYAAGLKVGGVLITSVFRGGQLFMHAGVGLNVFNRQPTTCLQALMEQSNDPQPVSKEALLAGILNHLEGLLETLENEGFEPMEQKYLESWLHSDQRVEIEEGQADGKGMSRIPVTIRGLSPDGFLLAVDDDGTKFELQPDGNSLDMMKGLICKKL